MNKNRSESDLSSYVSFKRKNSSDNLPLKKFVSEIPIKEISLCLQACCVLIRNQQGYDDLYVLNYEKTAKNYEVLQFPLYFNEKKRFFLKENLNSSSKYQINSEKFYLYANLLLYVFELEETQSFFLLKSTIYLSDHAINPSIFFYFSDKIQMFLVVGGQNQENSISFYKFEENREKASLFNIFTTKNQLQKSVVFLQKSNLLICDFSQKIVEIVKLKAFQSSDFFNPVESFAFSFDFLKNDAFCDFFIENKENKILLALKNEPKLFYFRIKESGVKLTQTEFLRPNLSFAGLLTTNLFCASDDKVYVLSKSNQKNSNYLKVYEINK